MHQRDFIGSLRLVIIKSNHLRMVHMYKQYETWSARLQNVVLHCWVRTEHTQLQSILSELLEQIRWIDLIMTNLKSFTSMASETQKQKHNEEVHPPQPVTITVQGNMFYAYTCLCMLSVHVQSTQTHTSDWEWYCMLSADDAPHSLQPVIIRHYGLVASIWMFTRNSAIHWGNKMFILSEQEYMTIRNKKR